MLVALSMWRRLLVKGPAQYGDVSYLGTLPLDTWGEDYDVLVGLHAGVETRFYFSPETGQLAAMEFYPSDDAAPCRLKFSKLFELEGHYWPGLVTVSVGDTQFADFELRQVEAKRAGEDGT